MVVTLGFFAAIAYVTYQRREDLTEIFEDPGAELLAIGLLVVVGHFLNSMGFWLLYRAQGLRIGMGETWLLFFANQLGNLLPGQVGTLYRFRYLQVVHRFGYAKSVSNAGVNVAITFGSSAAAALLGMAVLSVSGTTVAPALLVAGIAFSGLALVLMFFPPPRLERLPGRAGRMWRSFWNGWEDIRRQPGVAASVLTVDLVKYLLIAWRFQIA